MAEKKYLSVYGKGATEVVGRILPVWKNENRSDKDFGHMTTNPPSQKEEHWSRHLALQDLTGGLNYIGPYPDRHSTSIFPADLLKAISEKAAEIMLQATRNNELVILNHVTGEKPILKRLSQTSVLSPNIEKQLEFGEKELKVIKRSEPGKNNMETRWEWNEDVISKESAHVLPPGIRAVVPADDPIIPIITTKANMERGKIRVEGVNPLDWKKETFWLKDVKDPSVELKLLQTSPGAIRMFRPRKYFRDCLCEANIVHGIRPDYTQHVKDQNLLKKKYKEAVAVCSNIIKKKNNFCVTKNDYDNLCQIGVTLFQDDDFRQTLKADAEVLKFFKADEEDIRLLETLTSTVEDVVSGKRKPLSGSETITLLNNLNSIMEHPELKGFRPGEMNTKILEPLGPEYFISGRCIALLEALREYGGALCHADKSIKALVWQMDEDTFRNPQPVKPAQDGNKVLPLLAKKHLDKLSEEKNNHMYMATRDSILVLVPGFEEKAAEAVRRLEEKLEKDGKIYATPNKAGYVCIPQYRSGYIRRLPDSDVMVQVRATIANVWVLPNTAQRYIKGLKEWMEKNGIENHAESTTANAADLTRMILMSPGNASVDERLALLQKAAKELLIEKEKHKSTKVSANDSKNTRTL